MAKILFSCFIGLICYVLICFNPAAATNCSINSCQDIRALAPDCPVVSLYSDISGHYDSALFCIKMANQILDLNGHSIKFVSPGWTGPAIEATIGGIIRNGKILDGGYSPKYITVDISTGYHYTISNIICSDCGTNELITVTGVDVDLMLDNINATGTDGMIVISTTGSLITITHSRLHNTDGSGNPLQITAADNTIRLTTTEFLSGTYAIRSQATGNIIDVTSARFCYGTTADISSSSGTLTINSLGTETYYDTNTSGVTLTGARTSCSDFEEWENETEPAAYTHCTSPDYNDLSELGLYDLIMLGLKETTNTSTIDKYAFKIKIQNETLFNSINITSNKICLEKKGSYFRYCVDGVSQSSMYDAMSDNLEGYNYAQLLEFKGSMTGNWFIETFLKDIFIATDNQVISAAYCNQNNLNCGWLGCTCKGYKYEFNLDALESGDYTVYMELNTSTGCAYYLYLDSATLNGQLDEDLTTKFPGISDEPIPGGSNITVKKKLFFTGKFEGYLTGDLCNYTVYAKGVNGLKAADVLFYLTADTATNRYSEDEIIETKQASYDEVNDRYYAVFDVCSELYADVYKIGFFGRVRDTGLDEWVDLDNQGYIATMNKSSNGSVNNFYYYIDNSTKISYGVNDSVSSSDDANDKYFLPPVASGFSWYDILFWGIIIFFVIIVLWLIMGVLTRSPVKKFYGYSKR